MKIQFSYVYAVVIVTIILIAVLMVGVGYYYENNKVDNNANSNNSAISNFEECVAAGNPVMESYPRKCAAGGVTYTEVITNTNTSCANDYCNQFHYSNCPSNCTANCTPSTCDGDTCTADCDGPGSCTCDTNVSVCESITDETICDARSDCLSVDVCPGVTAEQQADKCNEELTEVINCVQSVFDRCIDLICETEETTIQFPDTVVGVSCTDNEDCIIVDKTNSVGNCCPTPSCRNWYTDEKYVSVNSKDYYNQALEYKKNNCTTVDCPQLTSPYCPVGEAYGDSDCIDNVCVKKIFQATIDTTDWLTYENEKHGFSFEYPNDWEIKNQTNIPLFVKQDGRTFKYNIAGLFVSAGEWRSNMAEGGGGLMFYFMPMDAMTFISEYNSDGDEYSQVTKPVQSFSVNGQLTDRVTAGTAIGLDKQYIFFNSSLEPQFFFSYDAPDLIHNEIINTIIIK